MAKKLHRWLGMGLIALFLASVWMLARPQSAFAWVCYNQSAETEQTITYNVHGYEARLINQNDTEIEKKFISNNSATFTKPTVPGTYYVVVRDRNSNWSGKTNDCKFVVKAAPECKELVVWNSMWKVKASHSDARAKLVANNGAEYQPVNRDGQYSYFTIPTIPDLYTVWLRWKEGSTWYKTNCTKQILPPEDAYCANNEGVQYSVNSENILTFVQSTTSVPVTVNGSGFAQLPGPGEWNWSITPLGKSGKCGVPLPPESVSCELRNGTWGIVYSVNEQRELVLTQDGNAQSFQLTGSGFQAMPGPGVWNWGIPSLQEGGQCGEEPPPPPEESAECVNQGAWVIVYSVNSENTVSFSRGEETPSIKVNGSGILPLPGPGRWSWNMTPLGKSGECGEEPLPPELVTCELRNNVYGIAYSVNEQRELVLTRNGASQNYQLTGSGFQALPSVGIWQWAVPTLEKSGDCGKEEPPPPEESATCMFQNGVWGIAYSVNSENTITYERGSETIAKTVSGQGFEPVPAIGRWQWSISPLGKTGECGEEPPPPSKSVVFLPTIGYQPYIPPPMPTLAWIFVCWQDPYCTNAGLNPNLKLGDLDDSDGYFAPAEDSSGNPDIVLVKNQLLIKEGNVWRVYTIAFTYGKFEVYTDFSEAIIGHQHYTTMVVRNVETKEIWRIEGWGNRKRENPGDMRLHIVRDANGNDGGTVNWSSLWNDENFRFNGIDLAGMNVRPVSFKIPGLDNWMQSFILSWDGVKIYVTQERTPDPARIDGRVRVHLMDNVDTSKIGGWMQFQARGEDTPDDISQFVVGLQQGLPEFQGASGVDFDGAAELPALVYELFEVYPLNGE